MFYRRKVILALLELFDGELEKIRLQKLLFLFTKRQTKTEYDFVPYKYGCYSYSANADLTTMVRKGMLAESESHFKSLEKNGYVKILKEEDRRRLHQVKILYGKMNADELMKHTYINYPFFAINSVKAATILNPGELEQVNKSRPVSTETILFTIGYEGISLEEYLNRLLITIVR